MPAKKSAATEQQPAAEQLPFEDALAELEALVEQLEGGEPPLEQSLAQFERGVALARHCQRQLAEAEQKVQQLSGEGDEQRLDDFDA